MEKRTERLSEALREAAALYLAREAGPQSLITVTRVLVQDGGREATIFISVLPESAEQAALDFARRHRRGLGELFAERVRGVRIPRLSIEIDLGEKNRERIEELSRTDEVR